MALVTWYCGACSGGLFICPDFVDYLHFAVVGALLTAQLAQRSSAQYEAMNKIAHWAEVLGQDDSPWAEALRQDDSPDGLCEFSKCGKF